MTNQSFARFRKWLTPLSWIYGGVVQLRNKMFDNQVLKSKTYNFPIICVGNLAVGGTGKTPQIEYLIKLLQEQKLNIATLSRGYKRKSKGYLMATPSSTAAEIGDEPYQLNKKFPNIMVAVDKDRCHGIEQLMALEEPSVDVILLDDAYQHRYVKAGLNILLTDYHHLFSDDQLLPAGNLRESCEGKNRAQIIIVTKCPENMKPIDFTIVTKKLDLFPFQELYFSKIGYSVLNPLFPRKAIQRMLFALEPDEEVMVVTGIASPQNLVDRLKTLVQTVKLLEYPDHHDFSTHDLMHMEREFKKMQGSKKLIITTEKDAARLVNHPALSDELKRYLYTVPIEIEFFNDQQATFNQSIINYVRKYTENS